MHLTSNFMYVLTILYLLFAKLKAKLIGLKTSNQSLRILKLSACKLTQLVPSPSRVVRNNPPYFSKNPNQKFAFNCNVIVS